MTREEMITKIEDYSAEIFRKIQYTPDKNEQLFLVCNSFYIKSYANSMTIEDLENRCFELERILLTLL